MKITDLLDAKHLDTVIVPVTIFTSRYKKRDGGILDSYCVERSLLSYTDIIKDVAGENRFILVKASQTSSSALKVCGDPGFDATRINVFTHVYGIGSYGSKTRADERVGEHCFEIYSVKGLPDVLETGMQLRWYFNSNVLSGGERYSIVLLQYRRTTYIFFDGHPQITVNHEFRGYLEEVTVVTNNNTVIIKYGPFVIYRRSVYKIIQNKPITLDAIHICDEVLKYLKDKRCKHLLMGLLAGSLKPHLEYPKIYTALKRMEKVE